MSGSIKSNLAADACRINSCFDVPRSATLASLAIILCASLLASPSVPAQQTNTPKVQSPAEPAPKFDNVKIDSLDVDAWNGIAFVAHAFGQPSHFALRFGSSSRGTFLDGSSIYESVREVGPHAPDGSYSRLSWQVAPRASLVTLEWSRIDDATLVGRITAKPDFQTVLETYIPFAGVSWGVPAVFSIAESPTEPSIIGVQHFEHLFGPAAQFVVMIDRPATGSGTYPGLNELAWTMKGAGVLVSSIDSDPSRNAAGLQFSTGASGVAHFVATLGWDKAALTSQARALLAAGKIDAILAEKSAAYAARRPTVQGLFEGAPEAIGNNMFWNSLYAPQTQFVFPSISRRAAHSAGGWVLGEWDGFFGSLLTSLEDKDQSINAIREILLAQTDTGLVPNGLAGGGGTPDRSQPPVGSYAVWKVFQRYPDRTMLEWAYPRLKRWHEWWFKDRGDGQPWRDGNRDGLLEWGSNRGSRESSGGRGFRLQAGWESGMDDSPMYDAVRFDEQTHTMDLDDVGLNSLYALDAECLAEIATILNKPDDAKAFQTDYEKMKQRVQEKLWNEADGIFENRSWNGEFSKTLSPTNFYPMLAGIATADQARRMVNEHLLNPKEFWGEYVVPTSPRNDPAFDDQYYWRGSIWGPTNYLLYHAIDRYGFDSVALDFARKSYALFMDDWKTNQRNNELYHAWGGPGGGDNHYTWGTLLCLIPLEQFLDVNPWDGLRFGALDPASNSTLHRVPLEGHTYDVTIAPNETTLVRDSKIIFHADTGVVVRNYLFNQNNLSFGISASRASTITLSEFKSVGPVPFSLSVTIDGQVIRKFKVVSGSPVLSVPGGEHSIAAALLPS
jgi:Trehalase